MRTTIGFRFCIKYASMDRLRSATKARLACDNTPRNRRRAHAG